MKMNLTLQNKGSFLTRFLLIGVFLVTLSMPTWAQEKITVSGKILDNTNEPLPGAAVLVQGSKDGTQSDINGEYVITVNSNAVLEFYFIGYKSQSVSVNGRAKNQCLPRTGCYHASGSRSHRLRFTAQGRPFNGGFQREDG